MDLSREKNNQTNKTTRENTLHLTNVTTVYSKIIGLVHEGKNQWMLFILTLRLSALFPLAPVVVLSPAGGHHQRGIPQGMI